MLDMESSFEVSEASPLLKVRIALIVFTLHPRSWFTLAPTRVIKLLVSSFEQLFAKFITKSLLCWVFKPLKVDLSFCRFPAQVSGWVVGEGVGVGVGVEAC